MKILTINTKVSSGGAAKIAYSIHNSINSSKGNESVFLAGYGEIKDNKCIKINNDKLKYISALSFRLTSKEVNFSTNIEKYIYEADIIHIHNIHGYYLNYKKIIEYIIKYDKPLVWTLHDIWALTGRCAIASECMKWQTGCGKCVNKNLYPKSFVDNSKREYITKKNLFAKLNKNKTTIVTPSIWLKKLVEKSILKDFNVVNIPNAVDVNTIIKYDKNELREKYGIQKYKKVILFIAANPKDRLKGIHLLFETMEKLNDVVFISVGNKIKCKYPNLIQLGYISSNRVMNEIYALSDIYVNPSLSENFPTTNLEAFANRVPIIAFSIGGIVEQLANNCGILVPNISEASLCEAITEFIKDEFRMIDITNNAFNKYLCEYSYDRFIENYIKIYYELEKNLS